MSLKIQIKRGTDAEVKAGTLVIGEMGFATDTKHIYIYDGVAKQIVGRATVDTLINRPAFGSAGRFFMDSSTSLLYIDNGSAWVSISQPDAGAATKGITQLSGDLGGSATAPTVVSIHSGATALAISTITDGQFLKRVGTDIVSATAGAFNVALISFTQATSSPALLLDPPDACVITKVVIVVSNVGSATAASTVSVGVSGTAGRDMAATDVSLPTLGTYVVEPYTACGTGGANISLTVTRNAAETFAGTVYLHYAVPV